MSRSDPAGSTAERRHATAPFFSVCIPQYNRTSFLIEACRSLMCQSLDEFEVCISDDCSTDGRESELRGFLESARLAYAYRRRERNGRYDANLRSSLELARGRYCLLMGNDDALAGPETLAALRSEIESHQPVEVAITNYADYASGAIVRRIRRTAVLGAGPAAAARHFRNLSFVSGIVLATESARRHATEAWDGSELYQVFLGTRLLAAGGRLLGVDRVAVRQGIRIPGEEVDSYSRRPRLRRAPLIPRPLNIGSLGVLVDAAIAPYLAPRERQRLVESALRQVVAFTYPFWLVEYRRVQSWRYALGICLGLRPRRLLAGLGLPRPARIRLGAAFLLASLGGLTVPIRLFDAMRGRLHAIAKSA